MAASQSASALRFHVFTERFHTFVHLQRDSCTSGSGQLNLVKPDHETGETTRARPDGGPRSVYLHPVIKSGKHTESVRLIWFAALLPGWGQNRLMRHYWLIVESQRPHAQTHIQRQRWKSNLSVVVKCGVLGFQLLGWRKGCVALNTTIPMSLSSHC